MLKNTFLHIPGVGGITEKRFWDSGIHSWQDFTKECPVRLSQSKQETLSRFIQESQQHIQSGKPRYFSDLLPANQHWRFFPEFRDSTVYLDIETTGLERYYNSITTMALYDGEAIYYYVNGRNLDDFLDKIKKYKVIVSYNGKSFDIPFIESYFGVKLNHAHIDLRYILASLGYTGGLKSCEAQLGIDRGDLQGIDGYFAVLLWNDYQENGNEKALESILAYNIQDTVNLEALMIEAYNMKIRQTPFYRKQLKDPVFPKNPFRADMKTVERIKSAVFDESGMPYY